MNLSTFFRATLSADPTADVPLEEEIKLQRLYLDIEQIRFPDRLSVEVDVPDALLIGARAGADPPADRRECGQIWRRQVAQAGHGPDQRL